MRDVNRIFGSALIVALFLVLAGVGGTVQAQTQEPMVIEATAQGTSTQLGRMVNIVIYIDQLSTQGDRKTLIDAFNRSGQDGLADALEKMKAKGRIRTPYGVGNEVKYIIELPPDNKGRRHLRLVTDRRISIGELYASTRSSDYSVGAMDLFLTPDGKGSEGTALPACRLTVRKKTKQIEIETFQNPWKIVNLMFSKE